MAQFGPLKIPAQLTALSSIDELGRFVTSFAQDVVSNFNGLVGTREVGGFVGFTLAGGGTQIVGDGGFFGVSLINTGLYWISLNPAFSSKPFLFGSMEGGANLMYFFGATNTGFSVVTQTPTGIPLNLNFYFQAKGSR